MQSPDITKYIPKKLYDTMKYLVLFFLPALALLVMALAGTWGFEYGEQVSATIVAVQVFLGALVGIDSLSYNAKLKQPHHDTTEIQ